MLFLNNAFTKDITEYDGEVLKEVKTVDGKIYLSNGTVASECTCNTGVTYMRLNKDFRFRILISCRSCSGS